MAKKRALEPTNTQNKNASETLDAVNVRLRRKSGALRRSIEAGLEEKTRKRRTTDRPVSSNWKR